MADRQRLKDMLDVIPLYQRHRLDQKLDDTGSRAKICRCINNWKTVAQYLPNIKNDITNIEYDNRNYELQKINLLEKWLDRNGPFATYRQLAEALNSAGEMQALEALVKELGGEFSQAPPPPETTGTLPLSQTATTSNLYVTKSLPEPNMRDLIMNVKVTNPYDFGIHLNLDRTQLDIIRANYPNDHGRQLSDVFNRYLQQTEDPSWIQIVEALQAMGETHLAKELRKKYGIKLRADSKRVHSVPQIAATVTQIQTTTSVQQDPANGDKVSPDPIKPSEGISQTEPTHPPPTSHQSLPQDVVPPAQIKSESESTLIHRPIASAVSAPKVTNDGGNEKENERTEPSRNNQTRLMIIVIVVLVIIVLFLLLS